MTKAERAWNGERLTDALAGLVGLRKAPGRYLGSDRTWIPESRFRPLVDLKAAFRVLDTVTQDYSLLAKTGGGFTAKVRIAGRTGKATGEPKALVISLAVARAIGLDLEEREVALKQLTTKRAPGRKYGE